jgi:hypothetical protein
MFEYFLIVKIIKIFLGFFLHLNVDQDSICSDPDPVRVFAGGHRTLKLPRATHHLSGCAWLGRT